MSKTTKIYDENKEIYSGNYYVNTVIFKGRIHSDFKVCGDNVVKFALQISNGKNEKTGKWNSPTFANLTAFGEVGQKILKEYKSKDEIWVVGKYYVKSLEGKTYKGFIVRDVIAEKEIKDEEKHIDDDYLPF